MKRIQQGLGMVLIFVAGMVAMVWFQVWGKFPLPVDFSGQVHPLWMFPVWVYLIATVVIGGVATLFLIKE